MSILSAKRLAIIGSRDLAQLLAHHAIESKCYQEVVGFFDDFRPVGDPTPKGPVLGPIESLRHLHSDDRFDHFMVGIGYQHLAFRDRIFQEYAQDFPVGTVISRGCTIDSTAMVGRGSFLLPGCTLDAGVVLEDNCVLNTGVTIAHDSKVGASTFLAPGVTLAGFIEIGSRCFLGTATVVIDSIKVASNVQTGAGAVVVKNIEQSGLYLGVPARFAREVLR